jgi:hypothetical protein
VDVGLLEGLLCVKRRVRWVHEEHRLAAILALDTSPRQAAISRSERGSSVLTVFIVCVWVQSDLVKRARLSCSHGLHFACLFIRNTTEIFAIHVLKLLLSPHSKCPL